MEGYKVLKGGSTTKDKSKNDRGFPKTYPSENKRVRKSIVEMMIMMIVQVCSNVRK